MSWGCLLQLYRKSLRRLPTYRSPCHFSESSQLDLSRCKGRSILNQFLSLARSETQSKRKKRQTKSRRFFDASLAQILVLIKSSRLSDPKYKPSTNPCRFIDRINQKSLHSQTATKTGRAELWICETTLPAGLGRNRVLPRNRITALTRKEQFPRSVSLLQSAQSHGPFRPSVFQSRDRSLSRELLCIG